MPNYSQYSTAFRGTATGNVAITSSNAHIMGVMFNGTGTGGIRIFAGTTATVTAAGVYLGSVIAYPTVANATVNAAVYYPFPAYCSGGITINIQPSADPQLTLFWNPA